VLQENEIDRVGGRLPIPINVSMIATTNQDLSELIVLARWSRP
jgi:transcriptional regulator with GAF, ATPase, and Fis domain